MIRRAIVLSILVVLLAAAPSTAGRNDTVDTLISAAVLLGGGPRLEKALGAIGSQSLEESESMCSDAALNARAKNIVNRLLSQSARKDLDYKIKVLNKSDVNAYALPGGHLYVNEGLLRLPGVSDDELAFVLGHELAHTNMRHGLKQMKSSILTGVVIQTVSRDAKAKLLGEVAQQLFLSGRSRKDESEADTAGFDYAVKVGYDPAGGLAFMRRLETLAAKEKNPFQQLFSTHPPTHDRAELLKDKMLDQEYGADFKTSGNAAALTESSRYSGSLRSKIGLLTDNIVYLGDDRSGEKTVWSKAFYLTSEEVSSCTSAKITFQVKAIPKKDPIVCVNRIEIGRAVAKSDQWEEFEFPFDPRLLRSDNANLIDLETFIPDMWRSYDDCEVKQIWLVMTIGNTSNRNSRSLLDDWYPGDGHVHSYYSCYDLAYMNANDELPPQVYDQSKAARSHGLRWIMVTDHEYMFGKKSVPIGWLENVKDFWSSSDPNQQWNKMADECNVINDSIARGRSRLCLTMPGEEVGSCDPGSNGHYLCYGINGYVKTHNSECSSMIQRTLERGGFGFMAHPFSCGFMDKAANLDWKDWGAKGYSGVELINGGTIQPYATGASKPNWDQHLAEDVAEVVRLAQSGDWDIGKRPSTFHVGVGNSDAHWDGREYCDYKGAKKQDNYPGRGFTWLRPNAGELSKESVIVALKQGRCVASTSVTGTDGKWKALGPLVAFSLTANSTGKTVYIGDTIKVKPREQLTLTVDWAAASPVNRIRVIYDGGRELVSLRNPKAALINKDAVEAPKGESACYRDPQLLKSLIEGNLRFVSLAPLTQTVQFEKPTYIRVEAYSGDTVSYANPIWVVVE